MSQVALGSVGTTPVAVQAGAAGWSVTIRQTPGNSAISFKVYDSTQTLVPGGPIQQNGTYTWTAPQTGAPFYPGQIVGYVAVASGTANFLVNDGNPVPFAAPLTGGVLSAAGAIVQKTGRSIITAVGATAFTLAAPIPGQDDFKELHIIDTTGAAHTVTTPLLSLNNTLHIATFGGVVGTKLVVIAYNGIWYAAPGTGNGITIS